MAWVTLVCSLIVTIPESKSSNHPVLKRMLKRSTIRVMDLDAIAMCSWTMADCGRSTISTTRILKFTSKAHSGQTKSHLLDIWKMKWRAVPTSRTTWIGWVHADSSRINRQQASKKLSLIGSQIRIVIWIVQLRSIAIEVLWISLLIICL